MGTKLIGWLGVWRGSRYLCVSYDLVDDFYYGNYRLSDGQPIPFLCSTCPSPPSPLIDRFTIGRTLMDAHSHPPSTGDRSVKLDLRFPIDLWSIYEAIDRDNLCRPIVLWQLKEGLGRRRWIVGRLQRPGSSSFCPIWRFPVPSSGKVKNGVPSRMRNDWMVYKRRRGTSSK